MKGEFHRSLGLELSGSKNDKSFVAVLDHHPKTRRLILVDVERLHDPNSQRSNDEYLIERVATHFSDATHFTGLAVNGPTSLPPYFESLIVRGKARAAQSEAEKAWLERTHRTLALKGKPFEPYLQRPVEVWLRHLCREKFQVNDALGANAAPLTARFQFLKPRLPEPLFEIFAKGTLGRVVISLGLKKQYTREYSDVEKGVACRELFLEDLTRKLPQIFLYEKDFETLVLNIGAFHAFLAALNLQLLRQGQCEKPPRSFPKGATWIALPLRNLNWDKIF